jgi:hypothetical protein
MHLTCIRAGERAHMVSVRPGGNGWGEGLRNPGRKNAADCGALRAFIRATRATCALSLPPFQGEGGGEGKMSTSLIPSPSTCCTGMYECRERRMRRSDLIPTFSLKGRRSVR